MRTSPIVGAFPVMSARLARAGALAGALALGLPAGCSSGSTAPATACIPGQSIACAGTHACAGHQVCNSDGTGFGECLCGDGGLRSFPRVGPFSGLLGAACGTGDDCRHGLECVPKDSRLIRGEAPSAGMCLQRCRVDHNFCAEVDATARCVVLDDQGTTDIADDLAFCMPGCKLGVQPAEADKCRGRIDLACLEDPAGAAQGYCRPACRSDVDCAPRVCDLSTGLCGDTSPQGDPIGASCDPNASKCAAGCFPQGGSFAECSGVCTYGTQGCGQNADPPLDFFCAIPASPGSGTGDLGYCAKLCNCDAECGRTDGVCEPHPELFEKTGRHGECASRVTPSRGVRQNLPCK